MTEPDPDRLRRLLDIEEIKGLKARYFRCMDSKDWDIVASVSRSLVGTQTVHHGHMPEIEVTGPDSARGTWAMADYVEWPRSDDGGRVGLMGYGHYFEEYVREDGEWHIARSRLDRLRVDPLT